MRHWGAAGCGLCAMTHVMMLLRSAQPGAAVQEVKLDAALGQLQAVVEAGGAVSLADYQALSDPIKELTLESSGKLSGPQVSSLYSPIIPW